MKQASQSFNDGIVDIYTVGEVCEPGSMPVESIIFKASLRFKQKTLGFNRVFVELQNGIRVDNIIRCPLLKTIIALDIAIVNGEQYRVKRVQPIEEIRPRVMDISLESLDDFYDIGGAL